MHGDYRLFASLSAEKLERLASAVSAGSVAGECYPERSMATINC